MVKQSKFYGPQAEPLSRLSEEALSRPATPHDALQDEEVADDSTALEPQEPKFPAAGQLDSSTLSSRVSSGLASTNQFPLAAPGGGIEARAVRTPSDTAPQTADSDEVFVPRKESESDLNLAAAPQNTHEEIQSKRLVPKQKEPSVVTVINRLKQATLLEKAKSQSLSLNEKIRLFVSTQLFPGPDPRPDLYYTPREFFIPVPSRVLASQVVMEYAKVNGPGSDEAFQRLLLSVGGYYEILYGTKLNAILDDYVYFDPQVGAERRVADSVLGLELDKQEDRFLLAILRLMERGNYEILTESELQSALAKNFMLMVQVDLNERELDGTPFMRFFENHEDYRRADLTDTFMVFHRGTGVERMTGYFSRLKLEVILLRLLSGLKVMYSRLFFWRSSKRAPREHSGTGDEGELDTNSATPSPDFGSARSQTITSAGPTPPERTDAGANVSTARRDSSGSDENTEESEEGRLTKAWSDITRALDLGSPSTTKERLYAAGAWAFFSLVVVQEYRYIRDNALMQDQLIGKIVVDVLLGLALLMAFISRSAIKQDAGLSPKLARAAQRRVMRASTKSGSRRKGRAVERVRLESMPLLPADLFYEHTIQEPTYKDVVVIYRPAGSRNFCIRQYRNIPLIFEREIESVRNQATHRRGTTQADLELVYPAKHVRLNYTSMLYTTIFVTLGLLGIAWIVYTYKDLRRRMRQVVNYLHYMDVVHMEGARNPFDLSQPQTSRAPLAAPEVKKYTFEYYTLLLMGLLMVAVSGMLSVRSSHYHYEATLARQLAEKGFSKDESVLHKLKNDCAEQEYSEVMLAYFILLMRGPLPGGELTFHNKDIKWPGYAYKKHSSTSWVNWKTAEEDVGIWAEDYILTKFGEELMFESKDALDKLIDLGFVEYRPSTGTYKAFSVDEATIAITEKWSSLNIGSIPKARRNMFAKKKKGAPENRPKSTSDGAER